MLVTLLGMLMLVRPEHPEKTLGSMLVTLSGMPMLVRPVQPEKALSPMLFTLSGMLISVRLLQPSKALLPILVTMFGMVMLLMASFFIPLIIVPALSNTKISSFIVECFNVTANVEKLQFNINEWRIVKDIFDGKGKILLNLPLLLLV